jgi:biopolymer transport protein TolR
MKKHSRKALRKIRRVKKSAAVTSINLVSMIDIFTIMIIYLLVNTAAVQIAGAEQIELPKSIAEEAPRQNVAVLVTRDDVLVDGRAVMKVADIRPNDPQLVLKPLKDALLSAAPITPKQAANATEEGGEVNILGDKSLPYAVLKKIMTTCADAQFAKISLGVAPAKSGKDAPSVPKR